MQSEEGALDLCEQPRAAAATELELAASAETADAHAVGSNVRAARAVASSVTLLNGSSTIVLARPSVISLLANVTRYAARAAILIPILPDGARMTAALVRAAAKVAPIEPRAAVRMDAVVCVPRLGIAVVRLQALS